MTLNHTFEKLVNGRNQVMTVSVKCDHPDEFGYEDVSVYVSHGGQCLEISSVLGKAGLLTDLVDSIDWKEVANTETI